MIRSRLTISPHCAWPLQLSYAYSYTSTHPPGEIVGSVASYHREHTTPGRHFGSGTVEGLKKKLVENLSCRYLLIDQVKAFAMYTGFISRMTASIRAAARLARRNIALRFSVPLGSHYQSTASLSISRKLLHCNNIYADHHVSKGILYNLQQLQDHSSLLWELLWQPFASSAYSDLLTRSNRNRGRRDGNFNYSRAIP